MVPRRAPDRVIAAAVTWLGGDEATAERVMASPHRRPSVYVQDQRISVIAFAASDDLGPEEVHLYAGAHGLVLVCPEPLMPVLREVVGRVHGRPVEALLAVLQALADRAWASVQELADAADRLDQSRIGLASGAQRRAISGLRHRLLALQQSWMAHHLLCAPDGTLDEALDDVGSRRLRHSGATFEASAAAAAQLYALLGDTLSRQSAIISERLTLVTVTCLPLTVVSSFFGMNFGWMTDHIGSAAAFILLGVVLPLALVVNALVGARLLNGR